MARLRYVKPTVDPGRNRPPSGIRHTVQSIRALYETEPEIARAVLPRPLEPSPEPLVFVQFANIAMHVAADRVVRLGAATVGVACSYEGRSGYYVLAMPMEGEFVVIGGREKYGEPKKIAETRFTHEGGRVNGQVARHGVTFLELGGVLGAETAGPKEFTEYFYCFKALPACRPESNENGGFDGDVLLTRLTWERNYTSVRTVENGQIILRDSAHDPLVDVPVKRIVSMEFAQGTTRTSGDVVRAVPGEWLAPYLVQRYDEVQQGIELALASELRSPEGEDRDA